MPVYLVSTVFSDENWLELWLDAALVPQLFPLKIFFPVLGTAYCRVGAALPLTEATESYVILCQRLHQVVIEMLSGFFSELMQSKEGFWEICHTS